MSFKKNIENNIKYLLRKEIVKEGLKYILVGGICTSLDFLVLYLLVNYFALNYVLSSIFSFSFAVLLNYYLCTIWIFKIRKINNKYKEILFYILISIVGLLLNSGFIWFFTETFSLQFLLSKVVVTPIVLMWNFLGRKYLLHTNNLVKNK